MTQPRRRLSADVRREQILEVGSRLFIEKGFEGVKMADIAEELQTSRPNIYTYYASTEAVLDTLLERVVQEWMEYLKQSEAAHKDSNIGPVFRALLERREMVLLLHSGGGPKFREHQQKVSRALDEFTARALPAEVDPYLLITMRTLTLASAYEVLTNPEYDPEKVIGMLDIMLTKTYEEVAPDVVEQLRKNWRQD